MKTNPCVVLVVSAHLFANVSISRLVPLILPGARSMLRCAHTTGQELQAILGCFAAEGSLALALRIILSLGEHPRNGGCVI